MKIAIYSRQIAITHLPDIIQLLHVLVSNNISITLFGSMAAQCVAAGLANIEYTIFNTSEELENVEVLISLGGDGTILDSATIVRDKNIPILGINFGRLGFLSTVQKQYLPLTIESLINKTFVAERHSLIHLNSSLPIFGEVPFALNEFAIHKKALSSMITIHTFLNNEFLNSYLADGLIVSTPTGSTGYNLSCNGPIIFPNSGSFAITPIAPHNLAMRPIVVSDTSTIRFEVGGRGTDNFICALDGRKVMVNKSIELSIQKESFDIILLRRSENSFLSTLREKLNWGADSRN